MDFFSNNDVTIAYQTSGIESSETLVFINSLGSDLRIWDAVLPHFENDYRLLCFDKRGHGLSDTPQGSYSLDAFTSDLIALLDHLKIEQATLIGVSIGGMIALNTVIQHPHRIKSLILCDTAAKLGSDDYWNERIRAVEIQGLDGMGETILSRWFAPSYAENHAAAYRGYFNMLSRTNQAGYIASCAALRDADLRDDIVSIKQASLVLCGAEDSATPPDVVRELAEALPDAQFDLIAGAGHTPSVEQPDVLAEKIDNFLKGLRYE